MAVNVINCNKRKDFKAFLQVPFTIHSNNLNWIPPLRIATKYILNLNNPFYKNAELNLWIAYINHKPVGRIAGIINHLHNKFYCEKIAFWGFFEAENSPEVVNALFQTVEHWAKQCGMTELRGPMNPSINYECGLQISAFDTLPFIMMPQNPEYYPALVEQQGYAKSKDLQAWIVNIDQIKIDLKKLKLIKTLQEKYQVTIRQFNMSAIAREMQLIANIYNDAWQDNWGYLPLDFEELNYLASSIKSFIMPNFIYIAEIKGVPCGFSVALPDLNQILLSIRNGKLLPFNILKLIWKIKIKKQITQGRIALLGVIKQYQNIPIGAMLYYEYLNKIKNTKCLRGEFSWILEDNMAMQAGLKFINASHYKTYRIYEKKI